jgi:hypothetical protein
MKLYKNTTHRSAHKWSFLGVVSEYGVDGWEFEQDSTINTIHMYNCTSLLPKALIQRARVGRGGVRYSTVRISWDKRRNDKSKPCNGHAQV